MRRLREAAAALLVAGASFAGSPAPAHADNPPIFYVKLTVAPNPSVYGQYVKITVDFGPYCTLNGGGPLFEIYSVQTASPTSFPTQVLGYFPIGSGGVHTLYTRAIAVGTNRVNGGGQCGVVYGQPDASVVTNEYVQIVKPKVAAQLPPAKSAPATHSKPPSKLPPVVFPAVHIQASSLAPASVKLRSVALIQQPAQPGLPSGALIALVAALATVAMIGALRRWRWRQRR